MSEGERRTMTLEEPRSHFEMHERWLNVKNVKRYFKENRNRHFEKKGLYTTFGTFCAGRRKSYMLPLSAIGFTVNKSFQLGSCNYDWDIWSKLSVQVLFMSLYHQLLY